MYESTNTKANVLAAARELFAERGYDSTSIRAITSLAQANLGAVTYHFESKENLYHEVLKSKTKPLQAELAAIAESPGTPLERIEAIARYFFNTEYFHPSRLRRPAAMVDASCFRFARPVIFALRLRFLDTLPAEAQDLEQKVAALELVLDWKLRPQWGQILGSTCSGILFPYLFRCIEIARPTLSS